MSESDPPKSVGEARRAWAQRGGISKAEATPLQLLGYYLGTGKCMLGDAIEGLSRDIHRAEIDSELPSREVFQAALKFAQHLDVHHLLRIPELSRREVVTS